MQLRFRLVSLILVLSLIVGSLPLWAAADFSNSQARQALQEILKSPEFPQDRKLTLSERIFRAILEWLDKGDGGWDFSAYLVLLVGLVLLGYLVINIAPFWKAFTPEIHSRQGSGEDQLPPTPANLLAQGEGAARDGNFRDALRYLYLSLLMELDGKKVITYRATKTNFEYLQEIRINGAVFKEAFRAMVDLFEYKWYGLEECTQEDYRRGIELYNSIVKQPTLGGSR